MNDITLKTMTLRSALARGEVRITPEAVERLKANDLPKKDVLATSRAAAFLGAKRCPDLIPHCHPIPLEAMAVDFEVQADRVVVTVRCSAVAKTGIEMEALTAVSTACLVIYDMLKPVAGAIEIGAIRLVEKRGGKSDFGDRAPAGFSAAVIVTSDGTSAGKRSDKSGRLIVDRMKRYGIEPEYVILPDERPLIAAKLKEFIAKGTRLVVTTGGTGLGPRDVTVEATRDVADREIPGIMEAARAYGQSRTPYAMLSRGLAAQSGNSIILNLPGSSKGVDESLNSLFPWVFHAYGMMRGDGH